jgi:hypothetical protein
MRELALLAAIALLAGCTGAGSTVSPVAPASAATTPLATPALDVASLDPCSLLDATELSTLLQATLSPQPAPDLDGSHVCSYMDSAASTSVMVLVADAPVLAGRGEDMVDQLPMDGRAEELHGVGEAAWFDYCPACPDDNATTLTVIEPPLEFTLVLTLPARDMARRIPLEELARGVIDRLRL